ncbi:MAG: LON peptidase substrate-binding domain-containing protein [candidate division Zixibacteria bacterium]|nr:LON peptidase substrate-binding domain-containing protein [candidate division Zixibacteria bacterium]
MNENTKIPISPLGVVLFPSTLLQLYIFEERYKEMVERCVMTESEFGILFFNEKDSQLCSVGCSARVTQILKRYENGEMDILVEGSRRFHVLELIQRKSYFEAQVEYFEDDESEEVPDDLLGNVLKSYQDVIKLQTKGVGAIKGIFDPVHFSFIIASTIDLDLPGKQTLLEITSTTERMRKLDTALSDTRSRLRELRAFERHAGSNGHGRHKDK